MIFFKSLIECVSHILHLKTEVNEEDSATLSSYISVLGS